MMNIRRSAFKITILIALIHCIIGNIIGAFSDGLGILEYLFLPYTFIAGLSAFAGWDFLSVILEVGSFVLMTLLFYPVGLFLQKDEAGRN
jgi:hypothetical protein